MDMISIAGQGIGALAIVLLMYALSKGAKKTNVRNKDPHGELRLPAVYLWLGLFCVLLVLVCLIALVVDFSSRSLLISLPIMLLFGGLGFPMFLAYFNHRVFFDEKYFRVRNWRNQVKEVEWSEIKHASFNRNSGYLRLESQHDKYYVNAHLVGFIEFLHELSRKKGYNATSLNIPHLL